MVSNREIDFLEADLSLLVDKELLDSEIRSKGSFSCFDVELRDPGFAVMRNFVDWLWERFMRRLLLFVVEIWLIDDFAMCCKLLFD